jgi:hypothetical protein
MTWDARNAPTCSIRRVTYAALVLSALALVPGTASFASSTPGPGTACKAGTKQVPGGTARILCTAKAIVRANGRTYAFKDGRCDLYPTYVAINIGSVAKRGSYFGLYMGKSPMASPTEPAVAGDGVYKNGLILLATPKVLAFLFDEADLEITLRNSRRAGAFSGANPENAGLKRPAVTMSGEFTC